MDYNNQQAAYYDQPNDYKTWSIINLVGSIIGTVFYYSIYGFAQISQAIANM